MSWGGLGHFSNALIVQQKRSTSPMPEKRSCIASFVYTAYTLYKTLCPNGDTWRGKGQPQKQGDKRQIAFHPPHPPHRGKPVNRPTPSRPTAFIFSLFPKQCADLWPSCMSKSPSKWDLQKLCRERSAATVSSANTTGGISGPKIMKDD